MTTYEALLNADPKWALLEGSMHFDGNNAVHRTLQNLVRRLEELGVDYAIAGGMALFFHGYRRFTEDVDVLVTPEGLRLIHEQLEGRGYVRPFEASKNLRDAETRVKIDFLVAGQYPGDGLPGPISFPIPSEASKEFEGFRLITLERLIELKLASGQASHRGGDLNDVQRLVQSLNLPESFAESIDPSVRDAYLAKWKDAQIAAREE